VISILAVQLLSTVTVVRSRLLRTADDETGANLLEYAFLVGLIAMVCLAAVTFFGHGTSARFSSNASAMQ
jgi:pilus assembly protein Flp/PilA